MKLAVLLGICGAAVAQPPEGGGGGGGAPSSSSEGESSDAVECAVDGSDYEYVEMFVGDYRQIDTNHCPNHPATGNANPGLTIVGDATYQIPRYPQYDPSVQTDLSSQAGVVGVALSGAMVYSPFAGSTAATLYADSATALEGTTFDACGGHASSAEESTYHYHTAPPCLLAQLGMPAGAHSPIIGWMFDGFPLYGPLGPDGTVMQTCTVTGGTPGTDVCLDDCGGYYGDVGDGYTYRYYMLGQVNDGTCCTHPWNGFGSDPESSHPHSPICLNGCCPDGADWCYNKLAACSDSAEVGHTAEPETMDALCVFGGACPETNSATCCDTDIGSYCGAFQDEFASADCEACTYTDEGVAANTECLAANSSVAGESDADAADADADATDADAGADEAGADEADDSADQDDDTVIEEFILSQIVANSDLTVEQATALIGELSESLELSDDFDFTEIFENDEIVAALSEAGVSADEIAAMDEAVENVDFDELSDAGSGSGTTSSAARITSISAIGAAILAAFG